MFILIQRCLVGAKYDSLRNESGRKNPFISNEKRIKMRTHDASLYLSESRENMAKKNILSIFKMAYNKAKDGHVKHSQRINKISLSLEQAMKCTWSRREIAHKNPQIHTHNETKRNVDAKIMPSKSSKWAHHLRVPFSFRFTIFYCSLWVFPRNVDSRACVDSVLFLIFLVFALQFLCFALKKSFQKKKFIGKIFNRERNAYNFRCKATRLGKTRLNQEKIEKHDKCVCLK